MTACHISPFAVGRLPLPAISALMLHQHKFGPFGSGEEPEKPNTETTPTAEQRRLIGL